MKTEFEQLLSRAEREGISITIVLRNAEIKRAKLKSMGELFVVVEGILIRESLYQADIITRDTEILFPIIELENVYIDYE